MNLHTLFVYNSRGLRIPISSYQTVLFLIHQERLLGALGLFAALVNLDEVILAGEFWVYEKGSDDSSKKLESNESSSSVKREEINEKDSGKTTAIYWIQPRDIKQRQNNENNEKDNDEKNNKDNDKGKNNENERNSKNQQIGRRVKRLSELKNIYDKGLLVNKSS
ncbi:354_t:CDS:2 [Cetraspora pellucida]|uniref:354_t:CDS:1 n=1 Tax=Cetraspora pellucida TaxID=1433469 RepID=A0A9N8WQB4_9GLOM|nr:354_t:CDS:2 [Cetraspora pellucida]